MKNKIEIYKSIAEKKFRRKVRSKQKRKNKRIRSQKKNELESKVLNGDYSYKNLIDKWMPPNIKYLLHNENSQFSLDKITKVDSNHSNDFLVPKHFSLVEKPKESYGFIQKVLKALIMQEQSSINIDYSVCVKAELGAQVLLDIILKDVISFYKKCSNHSKTSPSVSEINGKNLKNENVKKLLFSVGSPAIHANKSIKFDDIIPYKLCIHDREASGNPESISEQKDIDTTNLVDYVISSLDRMGKILTPEKLDDLCVVISEILINAEEHSTTKYRFSIGYFHEKNDDGNHYGVLNLVIMNFGQTIYEKFKDPDCPNKHIVSNMIELSKDYTKRNLFYQREFEEETLWSLYALQEGVTSIAPEAYKKRGNGSIQFIESFFNLKGDNGNQDNVSKMSILSGRTSISFDGKYKINQKQDSIGDKFKYMTFNKSGDIKDKPDSKYVKFVDEYFPGTLISAKILFNEDDLTDETK